MGWSLPPLVVLLVLAGVFTPAIAGELAGSGGPPLATTSNPGAAGPSQSAGTPTPTESGGEVSPGVQLAGDIGVRNAELEGKVESRAFEISIDGATSADAKANIVSERVTRAEHELEALERRRSEIRTALDNGSMTYEEYRARRATIAARATTELDVLTHAEQITQDLPGLILDNVSVDLTTIRTLQDRARVLAGVDTVYSG